MVDQYIDAHAGTHDLFDLGKSGASVKVRQPQDVALCIMLDVE